MNLKTESNNKRIAKNTALLYFRMVIIMGISIFISRIVLDALGASDYGLYNVVGGVVTLLTFINTGISAASQRFITFALGTEDLEYQKKVFCTSVLTHLSLAVVLFLLAETIGLWLVNHQLNIDPDRMYAANWVYQCSILTFVISVVSVPYNSCIVAHERMSVYAVVSMFRAISNLIVAYLIYISVVDKLIQYAVLLLFLQIVERFFYGLYCNKHFEECNFSYTFDKKLFREIFVFSGWTVLGNLGFSLRDQGNNVIMNIFCGTITNAARGIAMQISTAVNNFSGSFTIAINPQITKYYASGEYDKFLKLVNTGAKFSFFLVLLIGIPIIVNIEYILSIWLVEIPEHTAFFSVVVIIASSLNTISNSTSVALMATGQIRLFQILICVLMFAEIPLTYIILLYGYSVDIAVLPSVVTNFFAIFIRAYLLKKNVSNFNFVSFITNIIIRCLFVALLALIVCSYINTYFANSLLSLIMSCVMCVVITTLIVAAIGLNVEERTTIKNSVRKVISQIYSQIKSMVL